MPWYLAFRLANLIHRTNLSEYSNLWDIIRKIKIEIFPQKHCNKYGLYDDKLSQVIEAEKKLEMEPSEKKNENITSEELETAAKMFIFLNSCPFDDNSVEWFKSWALFYKDLFRTQSPDQIILTLNRMMKIKTPQDKNGKGRVKKLLQKTATFMSLQFDRIRNFIPSNFLKNISVEGFKIPNGELIY